MKTGRLPITAEENHMAFIRKKRKKNQDYYYVVENYRKDGKVHQRILEYIGPLENLMKYALCGWQAKHQNTEPSEE